MGSNNKIKLGDRVQDTITGFAGIAVAITKYLDKYTQIGIQSEKLKDELPISIQWFHDTNIIKVDRKNNNLGFGGKVNE